MSAADALVERSVWHMQSARSLTACSEWVRNATLEPSIATLALYVDVLTRFQ